MSSTRTTIAFAWSASSLFLLTGCPDDEPPEPEPVVPALFAESWATDYVEVRDCRRSGDHDLNYIRVLADATALATYQDRDQPFPEASVVLKPEYADEACTDLVGFTVMKKGAPGSAPDAGDWAFQKVGADLVVDAQADLGRCTSCHLSCGVAPDGHDWTCAVP